MRFALVLALLALAAPAAAQDLTKCTTSVKGEMLEISYLDDDATVKDNRSLRERIRGEHKGLDCPAFVTLRYLTPELDDTQRGPFCLVWDKKDRTYAGFAEGDRDAFLICEKPTRSFCERVNASADTAALVTGVRRAETPEEEAYLRHSSGAIILRGGDTMVTRSLSDALRASMMAVLGTAVTAVGATAATSALVVIGGTVYACRE